CADEGLKPLYYGGGTEIVTLARERKVSPGAVIDIKGVPECRELRTGGSSLIFGAGLSLNAVIVSEAFPLMSRVARGIADHTVRNRLSLGGNIAGQLPYRETVLPLLLAGATLHLAAPGARRELPIGELFSKRLKLETGELVVQVEVASSLAGLPWRHLRREKGTRTDYPIVSLSAMKLEGKIRMAVSGLCNFPFRSSEIEDVINDKGVSVESRIAKALTLVPGAVRDDQRASAEYRSHLFLKGATEIIGELEQG
ncbi:MAG TPA: FAD binding domain-containing protein, partial [Spirochaetia bacterium]|nr:FAD binding domain-containing protein [Spirochaetia bacterium]